MADKSQVLGPQRKNSPSRYQQDEKSQQNMKEIQIILDNIFPFLEKLLTEYKEFYPVGAGTTTNGNFTNILLKEDDNTNRPKSISVIQDLLDKIRIRKDNLNSAAIFYDVTLHDENTDAIAILVEHKIEKFSFTYYFPYKLENGELIFSESWKIEKEWEIFLH